MKQYRAFLGVQMFPGNNSNVRQMGNSKTLENLESSANPKQKPPIIASPSFWFFKRRQQKKIVRKKKVVSTMSGVIKPECARIFGSNVNKPNPSIPPGVPYKEQPHV